MQNLLLSSIPLDTLKTEFLEIIKKELPAIIASLQPSAAAPATELLTRKEAARLLGISLPTLNEWTKAGQVQGYRIASRVRYKRNEVEKALTKINTGKK